MRKIPTLFVRDPDDRAHVLPEVEVGCLWVHRGEGVATRKYDGTCVWFDGEHWWARRAVKPGKATPPGFRVLQVDVVTGIAVGWEPAEQSSFTKFLAEALAGGETWRTGTYELVGPKINRNPEGFPGHFLVEHATAELLPGAPRDFEGLREWLTSRRFEGIVWHHPDGRMAKLKRRDFTAPTAPEETPR